MPGPPFSEAPPGRGFRTLLPGRLAFREGLALQESLLECRSSDPDDVLILLEHPPVVTLGRGARTEHLLLSPETLSARGIDCIEAGRGGDVTFHGPGQLIGYPIVDLTPLGRDLHRYLRALEEVLIRTLAAFGVRAERSAGRTGVWVGGEKIASIGIGVRRWVAWHGFALNVADDLGPFDAIVPCGLRGVSMTSLEGLLGRPVPLSEAADEVIRAFSEVFSMEHTGEYETAPVEKTCLA